jgi:hypothetical protein
VSAACACVRSAPRGGIIIIIISSRSANLRRAKDESNQSKSHGCDSRGSVAHDGGGDPAAASIKSRTKETGEWLSAHLMRLRAHFISFSLSLCLWRHADATFSYFGRVRRAERAVMQRWVTQCQI